MYITLQICHLDVTAAFLNGTLQEMVYMRQLRGFEEKGKELWVWKLKKAIYSLKQGGHEWYTCIDEFFTNDLGFVHTFANHSVYIYKCGSSVIIVPLYVDDLLIGFKDRQCPVWECHHRKCHQLIQTLW